MKLTAANRHITENEGAGFQLNFQYIMWNPEEYSTGIFEDDNARKLIEMMPQGMRAVIKV